MNALIATTKYGVRLIVKICPIGFTFVALSMNLAGIFSILEDLTTGAIWT